MLYIIPTPIGNLADITLRAIEVLKSCDYILCEDTRHSSTLLTHYEISKPLKSFHKFNETAREKEIVQDLQNGKNVALITDAGTPGISDPGSKLVQLCVQEKIPISSLPGACAAITALTSSGLLSDRFQFCGFLPRKPGELRQALLEILTYQGTTICYESPLRMKETLEKINELSPTRPLAIARELTKKFEEILHGNAQKLIDQWKDQRLKGEAVLLISGDQTPIEKKWEDLQPDEHVQFMQQAYHLTRQEAIKMVAELRGVSKRDIYNFVEKKRD